MLANMLDLSTSHLPLADVIDFGDLRVVEHEEDWIIFVAPIYECPPWLELIMEVALASDCILINFDSDASIDEKFIIFN